MLQILADRKRLYLASNGSNLPSKELRKLATFIAYNHGRICDAWKDAFGVDALRFYR